MFFGSFLFYHYMYCRYVLYTFVSFYKLFILIVMYAPFCTFCFLRANWHSSATLTEVFSCFFLSCKANATE